MKAARSHNARVTPYAEWTNATGRWLILPLPGMAPLMLRPSGRLQIPCAGLLRAPRVKARLDELEQCGTLLAPRRYETCAAGGPAPP